MTTPQSSQHATYVGLDVSLAKTNICVLNAEGVVHGVLPFIRNSLRRGEVRHL
jgi:hypothetical protein